MTRDSSRTHACGDLYYYNCVPFMVFPYFIHSIQSIPITGCNDIRIYIYMDGRGLEKGHQSYRYPLSDSNLKFLGLELYSCPDHYYVSYLRGLVKAVKSGRTNSVQLYSSTITESPHHHIITTTLRLPTPNSNSSSQDRT